MAISSTGTFSLLYDWEQDKLDDIKVRADRMMGQQEDIADAMNAQIDRAGLKPMQGDLNMGANKVTNMATGTSGSDAVTKAQMDTQIANINARTATTTSSGFVQLATLDETITGAIETKAVTPYGFKNAFSVLQNQVASVNLQRDSIYGFFLAGIAGQFTLRVDDGGVYDRTFTQPLIHQFPLTKNFNSTWTVGDNGGGRPDSLPSMTGDIFVFVLGKPDTPSTSGTLTTIDLATNLSNITAVTDGSLSLLIDSIPRNFTSITFSGDLTLGDVADTLNTAVNTYATASLVGNTIVFTSKTTGATSTVTATTAGSGTDLYGASYLDLANATPISGTNSQLGDTDIGMDTDEGASNLMADANVVAAGFIYVRLIAQMWAPGGPLTYAWLALSQFGREETGSISFSDHGKRVGSLLADGSAVSRTTYYRLFLRIGTRYGAGDGSTTFNVPDMRGLFVGAVGINGAYPEYNGTSSAGVLQRDSAPNILGAYDGTRMSVSTTTPGVSGAFGYYEGTGVGAAATGAKNMVISFDASSSNAAYGRDGSAAVRPACLPMWAYIKD